MNYAQKNAIAAFTLAVLSSPFLHGRRNSPSVDEIRQSDTCLVLVDRRDGEPPTVVTATNHPNGAPTYLATRGTRKREGSVVAASFSHRSYRHNQASNDAIQDVLALIQKDYEVFRHGHPLTGGPFWPKSSDDFRRRLDGQEWPALE